MAGPSGAVANRSLLLHTPHGCKGVRVVLVDPVCLLLYLFSPGFTGFGIPQLVGLS